jgi:hypothetical protein
VKSILAALNALPDPPQQEHQRMLQEVGAGATMQMQSQELQKAVLHLQQHLLLLLLYLIALQLLLHDQLNKRKNLQHL